MMKEAAGGRLSSVLAQAGVAPVEETDLTAPSQLLLLCADACLRSIMDITMPAVI